jgi:hypothetical protein
MQKLIVYIPTLKREGKQYTLESIPDRWKDRVFLVCPKEEKHDWPNRIDVPVECIGSISKTRQWILEQAPTPYVGQFDDDLTFYKRDPVVKTKNHKQADCGEFLDLMEKWLQEGDVFCGLSNSFMSHTNDSEYFYGKPSHCSFVNRDYMAKHQIRYDAIRYFEDFHVPLSVVESGHRLRYTGEHIAVEKKANAPGGCSITRTAENNRAAMVRLAELHPKYVSIKEEAGAKNQSLEVGVKLRIAFAKAYKDNVKSGETLNDFFS